MPESDLPASQGRCSAPAITWDHVLKPGGHAAAPAFDLFQNVAAPVAVGREFSLGAACELAAHSLLIYRPAADRQATLGRLDWVETFCEEVGGTLCSLLEPAGGAAENTPATLVFRGTSHLKNWLTNLRSLPSAWPVGGHVHGGFAAAHGEIYAALGPRLRSLADSGRPMRITGHSLGGALATLTLSQFLSERPAADAVAYTFGSPRVGNAGFAKSLENAALFRIVNGRDLVTRLPLAFPLSRRLSFLHAGNAQFIDAETMRIHGRGQGDLAEEQSSLTQIKEFVLHTADAFRKSRPPTFLADHAPALYLERLRQLTSAH